MMSRSKAYQLTTGVTGRRTVNYRNGSNAQLVHTIVNSLPTAIKQTKNLAPSFLGATEKETIVNLYNWIVKNIRYKRDEKAQIIPMPSRLLINGYADCKGLSLFVASILSNLGIQNGFRFVTLGNEPAPSHVYNYTSYGPVDTVLQLEAKKDGLFKESKYTSKQDFNNMEVVTINGVNGCSQPVNGRASNYVLLAPGRGAFSQLLRWNAGKLADKLDAYNRRDAKGLKKKWNDLGGNYTTLKKNIAKGKGKKFLNINGTQNGGEIGVVWTTVWANALVIIKALAAILIAGGKDIGDNTNPLQLPTAPTIDDEKLETPPNSNNGNGNNNGGGGFLSNLTNTELLMGAGILYLITKK